MEYKFNEITLTIGDSSSQETGEPDSKLVNMIKVPLKYCFNETGECVAVLVDDDLRKFLSHENCTLPDWVRDKYENDPLNWFHEYFLSLLGGEAYMEGLKKGLTPQAKNE